MPLNVYLHFNNNCREVFEFYRSVFGGDFTWMATFREGPPDMGVPEDEMDNVMHVSYDIGGTTLMGSDVPSVFGMPVEQGNNFSITYATESREQTDELFAKISEGGHRVHAVARHVLGVLLRWLHRQVRHQLDVGLCRSAGVFVTVAKPVATLDHASEAAGA